MTSVRDRPAETDRADAPEPFSPEDLRQRLERLPPAHPSAIREPRLTDREHADHVREVRNLLDKARAEGQETYLQHTIDSDHEQWTDERTVMHDAIIADLYAAASDVPCERRAILAGGLPGAGKTTVLDRHAGIDGSRYLTINPDQIKEEMAGRGNVPQVQGLTPMEASDLVHEESSHIAKRLARRAMREGKNVIWDITMSSRESTERRIGELRAAGYERVDGIFVDIPIEMAVRRSDTRHREGHERSRAGQGLGGRFVPAEVITAQADPEWGSRNRRTLEEVKPLLDAWAVIDNSADGRAPVLTESGGKEEEQRWARSPT
jgi:predicted kinase